jgi:hypothetical protein
MRFPSSQCASLLFAGLLAAASLVGCGRTDLEDELGPTVDASIGDVTTDTFTQPDTGFPDVMLDDGFPDDTFPEDAPFDTFPDDTFPEDAPIDVVNDTGSCGDGTCDDGETCTTCPMDCGFCQTCGDGTCESGETCSSCPQDCGACKTCGDGFCDDGEDCTTCPQDCGVCMSCGDGQCTGTENCTNCPADCGKCVGCGDGVCSADETCVSCPQDCGSCAVCGNGVCNDGETCTNCPQDCGACVLKDCQQALLCAFGCFSGGIQNLSVTCISDCDAEGCPSSQIFVNNAIDCAVQSFFNGTCSAGGGMGGALTCIEQACASEVAACFAEPPCATP